MSYRSFQFFRCKDNEIRTRARTAKAFLEISAFDAEHFKEINVNLVAISSYINDFYYDLKIGLISNALICLHRKTATPTNTSSLTAVKILNWLFHS